MSNGGMLSRPSDPALRKEQRRRRQAAKAHIPPSVFTKKHTLGVRATYRDAMEIRKAREREAEAKQKS